jgi:hypothetical protein
MVTNIMANQLIVRFFSAGKCFKVSLLFCSVICAVMCSVICSVIPKALAQAKPDTKTERHENQFQLNLYYGLASVNPAQLNGYLTSTINPTLSKRLSEIRAPIAMGAEFLFLTRRHLWLGGRYALQAGSSGVGETSGGMKREIRTDMSDVSLVLKYQWDLERMSVYIGAAVGMAPEIKISDINGDSVSSYSATNIPIHRGILGLRMDIGFVAVLLETGYQYITTSILKDTSGNQFSSGGQNIGIDLSGAFGMAGLGFQF